MKLHTLIPYPILRAGILNILQAQNLYEEIIISECLEALLNEITEPKTHIFVVSSEEKEADILDTLQRIQARFPTTPVILFCHSISLSALKKYSKYCRALLLHASSEAEIATAVAKVTEGSLYLAPPLEERWLAAQFLPNAKRDTTCKCLTKREYEVLNLIVEEYTTHEIAKELYVSNATVETHRTNLISKLGVKNTAGLVREACFNRLYQLQGA